jgi:N-acetylglucosamine malate deacetylase 1
VAKDSSAAWKTRHRRWLKFVQANILAVDAGKSIPLGPSLPALKVPLMRVGKRSTLKVVVCSPHPDDEALIGALPLRLRQECDAQVTNFAITLGSKPDQRVRRLRELKASCAVLGFRLSVADPPHGLENVVPENRAGHPQDWSAKVHTLSSMLEQERPDVVFAPHAGDINVTHVATHYLVLDALGEYLERTGRGPLPLIETEFWHQHSCPNLMIGVSPADEAALLMAAAEHGVEVRRNPYHLRHPARMIDNVRRGAEIVVQAGGPAPDMPFAEIYRLVFMAGRKPVQPRPGGVMIGPTEGIDWQSLVDRFRPSNL